MRDTPPPLTDRAWQEDIQKKVPLQRVEHPDEIVSVALFLLRTWRATSRRGPRSSTAG
jgi:hypothetical protein